MTSELTEQPIVLEIGTNTDEEDRYIKMKNAYKQGKLDCEACFGGPCAADELAVEYCDLDDEECIVQYLNGWNYMLHVLSE